MPMQDGCVPTPRRSCRLSLVSARDSSLSWSRSELLNAVHPLDDVLGVIRRVRLVEGKRPMGPQASILYELLLDASSELHTLIRMLEVPSQPTEP